MYVRNYGNSPRNPKREGDTAYLRTATDSELASALNNAEAKENAIEPIEEQNVNTVSEAPEPDNISGSEQATEERNEAEPQKAEFGVNGIPRQPLRRRKLQNGRNTRIRESVVSDLPETERESCRGFKKAFAPNSAEALRPLDPPFAPNPPFPLFPPCESESPFACDTPFADRPPEQPCTLPPSSQCDARRDGKRGCDRRGNFLSGIKFSTEELLLGGLIILLMNDRANDDILLILAFLLVSGG